MVGSAPSHKPPTTQAEAGDWAESFALLSSHLFEPGSLFSRTDLQYAEIREPQKSTRRKAGHTEASDAFKNAVKAQTVVAAGDVGDQWIAGLEYARGITRHFRSSRDQVTAADQTIAILADRLKEIIEAAPLTERGSSDYAELQNFYGNALIELGDRRSDPASFREAGDAYQKASSVWHAAGHEAAHIRAEINYGLALTKLAEDDQTPTKEKRDAQEKASRILQDCVERLTPESADWGRANLNLANALMLQGREQEAADSYERTISPHYRRTDKIGWANAQSSYSVLLTKQGRYQAAIKACRAALKEFPAGTPDQGRCRYNLANAYRLRGTSTKVSVGTATDDLEHAVTAYREALPTLPPSLPVWARAWYGLGQALLDLKRTEEAVRAFQAATQTQARVRPRERAGYFHALGAAFYGLGITQDNSLPFVTRALSAYSEAALNIDTNDPLNSQIRSDLLVVLSALDTVLLDVDKVNVAREFDRFLKAVGVDAPDVKNDIAKQVLPIIDAATRKRDGQPATAAAIEWPAEIYSQAHKKRGENIVQFLERVWQPLINDGLVDRRTLRSKDPSAEHAVVNYMRGGRALPTHVHIPKLKELNDQELAKFANRGDRPVRLDWVARSRAKRLT